MSKKQVPKPTIYIGSFTTAAPFLQAKEVGFTARCLLAMASNFRLNGANIYKICDNADVERILGISHGQFMRYKKQLRDAGLLDYEGNPGDYTHLKERWEQVTGETWRYDL